LLLLLVLLLLFPADREDAVVDRDLDVLAFHSRQFDGEQELVIGLGHLDGRRPRHQLAERGGRDELAEHPAAEPVLELVDRAPWCDLEGAGAGAVACRAYSSMRGGTGGSDRAGGQVAGT